MITGKRILYPVNIRSNDSTIRKLLCLYFDSTTSIIKSINSIINMFAYHCMSRNVHFIVNFCVTIISSNATINLIFRVTNTITDLIVYQHYLCQTNTFVPVILILAKLKHIQFSCCRLKTAQ